MLIFALFACSELDIIIDESNEPEVPSEPISLFEHIYQVNDKSIADDVYVIHINDLNGASEILLAVSLQGIVAQKQASIYIETNGPSAAYWFEELNIDYIRVYDVWTLVEIFYDDILLNGYILYEVNTESVNVASTLAGIERHVMITKEIEELAIDKGLVLVRDVSDRTTRWVIDTFKDQINFEAIASQPINNLANRDFIIANQGLIITSIVRDLEGYDDLIPMDTPMLGWGTDEVSDVYHLSQRAITTIASDHAWNLSFLSQVEREALSQISKEPVTFNENKHYVSFIMTDGDNIQWLVGNDYYFHEERLAHPERGSIPMGWTIAPLLYTLAPSVMDSYYQTATTNDEFIGGPSGIGYINPDVYPSQALSLNARRTSDYYEEVDLSYMTIIGSQNGFKENVDVMSFYANKDHIQGGFIFANFDRYMGYRGQLWWFNQKPFLSAREAMWDLDSLDPLANRVNASTVNPYQVDGYTLIIVHVWSHGYSDVVALSELFDDHVEIILPSQMMTFISEHVEKTTQIPTS